MNSDSKVKVLSLKNPNLTEHNNVVSIALYHIFFIRIISMHISFLYKQKHATDLTLIPCRHILHIGYNFKLYGFIRQIF